MIRLHGILAICLVLPACRSTEKPGAATDIPVSFEEFFKDDHTMILLGNGIAPPALSAKAEKALAYARLDARIDAERKFGDICYGVSIRPCEPKRRVEPRVAATLQKDLQQIREECHAATAADPAYCRVHFEFHFEGIRQLCENARSEDGMKILAAGCGAW